MKNRHYNPKAHTELVKTLGLEKAPRYRPKVASAEMIEMMNNAFSMERDYSVLLDDNSPFQRMLNSTSARYAMWWDEVFSKNALSKSMPSRLRKLQTQMQQAIKLLDHRDIYKTRCVVVFSNFSCQ